MGGLLIFFSVFGATFLWASPNIWVVVAMFVYAALTGVGFRDDYLKVTRRSRDGISSWEKILWQTIITVIALAAILWYPASAQKIREFWVPFHKEPVWVFAGGLGAAALLVLVFFWIVGFSNAINLTDGLDGLAIGCTITVALVYGIMAYVAGRVDTSRYLLISYVPGTGELAVICGALVGAGMAFLWYNSYPAEVFMGDTGSLAIGGLLGVLAFMVQQPLTLVIVGGVFVMEAVSVIIQVGVFKFTRHRLGRGPPVLPDGADPPPFPKARLAGNEGGAALLDSVAHVRPRRASEPSNSVERAPAACADPAAPFSAGLPPRRRPRRGRRVPLWSRPPARAAAPAARGGLWRRGERPGGARPAGAGSAPAARYSTRNPARARRRHFGRGRRRAAPAGRVQPGVSAGPRLAADRPRRRLHLPGRTRFRVAVLARAAGRRSPGRTGRRP